MASSCSAGLRFYGCPHVRMWRGAAAWQRRSRLWVSSRPHPLEGRSRLPAPRLQKHVQHWSKPTANEKNIGLNLSFVSILSDISGSSLLSPRQRPDAGMYFSPYEDCLLSLLWELLPSQSQTLTELFSFRTRFQDFTLTVGFKIQSWEKYYKKRKQTADNCITVQAVSFVERKLDPPARALKAELAECRLKVTKAESCSCDFGDGEWTLTSSSIHLPGVHSLLYESVISSMQESWDTIICSEVPPLSVQCELKSTRCQVASMFSLGEGRGGQGGLEITVFPTAQLQTRCCENHKEKKPRLINLLIFTQPPNVNVLSEHPDGCFSARRPIWTPRRRFRQTATPSRLPPSHS